ncbi:MAG: AAA family ATPase [Lachnospiraceae bacterium]|nr:AAA family ATPase [Lachnospiraceae bacterium]MBR4059907.1 AAA family ATPase [Lachnospiraceae bacterium]
MRYMTCMEAAEKMRLTVRRVQQMCKAGEIAGAVKQGHSWMIPINEKKKPLPIGISDFKVATTAYYYVDKTLLIRDFIDNKPMVSLFTRPRRFGKTLNMDMLRVFFEKSEEDTSVYFQDKMIWQCGNEYAAYQGKYPVIFLSFKDVKCSSWEETLKKIGKLISLEYLRHMELESSSKLNVYEREQFSYIANGKAGEIDYQMSLQLLSLLLHKHHEKEAIIIIDEYDTPIQQGHTCGFYSDIVNFMRNFFSGGLKDNSHLAYGFLTGILRVAKESIFSGLNNLKINSLLDEAYSQYFGFTKGEVMEMLDYYNVSKKFDEVCEWYDGYLFGNTEIFNPWSVINYISDKCFPKAFWQSTGSNEIIGEIIAAATPEVTENLHKLLRGENITTYVDTSVIYPEVQSNPYSIYSFLLIAGYLRVSAIYPQHDGNFMCEVGIPNKEISFVYEKEVLNKTKQNGVAISIQQAIFSGDTERLQELIEQFMLQSIASLDGANEGFYHGMMLGLCAVLSNRYQVRSNRESGLGRFDIMLIPRDKTMPGFIYEFKFSKDKKVDLNLLAEEALRQIEDMKYETELLDCGVKDIVKIGIAFRGKQAVAKK